MIVLPPGEADQLNGLQLTGLEQEILRLKQESPATYRYGSLSELEFELKTRSQIVDSARGLYASGAQFATFQNSRCNEDFWIRQNNGGFRLRSDVTPADGIRDIFRNGRQYAFECATAMVIVLYRAVLEAIKEPAFNTYFSGIILYDWQYDSDLRIISLSGVESYPGDVLYFKNPDFNPATPEWRGENAIKLPDGVNFAHGMGIRTDEEIIYLLNTRRIPGSTTSAYPLDQIETLDFDYISNLRTIVARIGSRFYAYALDHA